MTARDNVAKLRSHVVVTEPRFGARGNGTTDDAAAIQAAIDYIEALGGGVVEFPDGEFLCGAMLTINTRGVTLRGAGFSSTSTPSGATMLVADHNDGAAIRISAHETTIEGMTITASSARNAGSAGATATPCAGIHVEGPDAAGGSGAVQRLKFRDLAIQKHPSHGFLIAGLCSVVDIENVHVSYNLGHGMCFNRGTITGRTNEGYVGIVNITGCRSHDNAGHMMIIGSVADTVLPAYRFRVVNVEGYRNCSDATLLEKSAFIVACGQNLHFESNAFGSEDLLSDEQFAGVWVCGRVNKFINNRYIRCTQPAIVGVGGISTRDIEFNGMMMAGSSAMPYAQAVQVESGAQQVRVSIFSDQKGNDSQYVLPMPLDVPGYWHHQSDGLRGDFDVEMRGFSSTPEILLADDTVQELDFGGLAGGVLMLTATTTSDVYALVAFRVGTNPFIAEMAVGSDVATGTGALTNGTSDGTDGKFNISAHTDGILYLKNRCAGNRLIRAAIFCGINRVLETTWAS